jgi:hypothetical protein
MTDEAVSPLRRRMIEDMTIRTRRTSSVAAGIRNPSQLRTLRFSHSVARDQRILFKRACAISRCLVRGRREQAARYRSQRRQLSPVCLRARVKRNAREELM